MAVYEDARIAEARARGDTRAVAYWERIESLVDACPPLEPEQAAALRTILRRPVGTVSGRAPVDR